VQAGLVSDIDRLGTELKVIDIIVMPALLALAALLIAATRRRRSPTRSSADRSVKETLS
jgi:MYXO-CTERM domain-containing protein